MRVHLNWQGCITILHLPNVLFHIFFMLWSSIYVYFLIKTFFLYFGWFGGCMFSQGWNGLNLFQLSLIGKINLKYEEIDLQAKLQNKLNSYLRVLLYALFTKRQWGQEHK